MTLYLVMLELPAIIVAIALYKGANKTGESNSKLWHETLTNRGIVLLTGGLIIGFLYGPREGSAVTDLFIHSFQAILAIFLLEMGLTAADTLRPFPNRQVACRVVCSDCALHPWTRWTVTRRRSRHELGYWRHFGCDDCLGQLHCRSRCNSSRDPQR